MIRRLYDWTMGLAGHRHALKALAAISFIESSVFPIPPDVLMIPMVIAQRRRAFLIATVCTLASVAGGMLGYAIGAWLFEAVGQPILTFYGKTDAAAEFAERFNQWGVLAVLIAGVTPFPYKVITITAGWTGLSLPLFILTSIFARGLRFFIVAGLLWKYGEPIRTFIEARLGLLFTVFCLLLVGSYFLVRYL